MVCAPSLDALVSVVLTAKVTTSQYDGARIGDTLSLSFNVDPKWTVRDIVGQGIVEDGIGPFGVCDEHFLLAFSSGMQVPHRAKPCSHVAGAAHLSRSPW